MDNKHPKNSSLKNHRIEGAFVAGLKEYIVISPRSVWNLDISFGAVFESLLEDIPDQRISQIVEHHTLNADKEHEYLKGLGILPEDPFILWAQFDHPQNEGFPNNEYADEKVTDYHGCDRKEGIPPGEDIKSKVNRYGSHKGVSENDFPKEALNAEKRIFDKYAVDVDGQRQPSNNPEMFDVSPILCDKYGNYGDYVATHGQQLVDVAFGLLKKYLGPQVQV